MIGQKIRVKNPLSSNTGTIYSIIIEEKRIILKIKNGLKKFNCASFNLIELVGDRRQPNIEQVKETKEKMQLCRKCHAMVPVGQKCPKCGYVKDDIDGPIFDLSEVLDEDELSEPPGM